MRFISWKELSHLVPYTRQHIARLEAEGKFPRRLRLGNADQSRIVWVEAEVLEWMARWIKARDEPRDEAAEKVAHDLDVTLQVIEGGKVD